MELGQKLQPDIFDLYLEYVENSSEAPFQYHRWALLVGVGSLLGRQLFLPFGPDLIYPNMYALLLGPSAGRKSSAINMMRRVVSEAGFDKFAKERSSKEQFLVDLAKGFGANRKTSEELEEMLAQPWDNPEPCEVLICAGELEDFLGAKDAGFISLLTNLYDNLPKYEQPKLTGKNVYVHQPTVGLLGGATAQTFSTIFPPEAVGQGILSRLPLIHADGARCKITLPPPPPPDVHAALVDHLREVKTHMRGEMKCSPAAFKMIDEIYHCDFPLDDVRLVSYAGRRHMHLWKMCIVYAALDLSMVILPEHVLRANTVLHHSELFMPKALGEFGRSLNSGVTNTVMSAIQSATKLGGATVFDLMKNCSNDVKDMKELVEVVRKLVAAGKVSQARDPSKFIALPTPAKKTYPHVDFTLLREYDPKTLNTKT